MLSRARTACISLDNLTPLTDTFCGLRFCLSHDCTSTATAVSSCAPPHTLFCAAGQANFPRLARQRLPEVPRNHEGIRRQCEEI